MNDAYDEVAYLRQQLALVQAQNQQTVSSNPEPRTHDRDINRGRGF